MNKNERIGYLDVAKGIGILLVVIGHVEYVSESVRQYIAAFHMPFFLMISGILIWYKREEKREYNELFFKKVINLMAPYAIFSLLYFVMEGARAVIKGLDSWGTLLRQLYQTICLQGVSTLWFLPALFMAELIFIRIRKKSNHVQSLCSLSVLFVIVHLINVSVQSFFSTYSDNLLMSMLNDVVSMLLRNIFCVGLVGLGYYLGMVFLKKQLPAIVEILMGEALMFALTFVVKWNGTVDLRYMHMGNLALYLLGAFMGTLGVLLLCRGIANLHIKPINRVCEYYGRNSLIIMVTHLEFRVLYVSIKLATILNAVFNNHIVFCVMIVVFVFVLEILIIEFVNCFLPFIIRKVKSS